MDICFLFVNQLDENRCLCLKLSQDGTLIDAPQQLEFAAIKTLQKECKTYLVENGTNTSLFDLELPWLPDRKARLAIPYALEDKLVEPVEALHFAFDKAHYQNNHYLITVISKQRMDFILQTLQDNNIVFDVLTTEWFALSFQEMAVTNTALLINGTDFKGALTDDLAMAYVKRHPLNPPFQFDDSFFKTEDSQIKHDGPSSVWIAQRLLKTRPMNLCQGNRQQSKTSNWIFKGYALAGILCGVWLISILLANAINLYSVNKKTEVIDRQIAVIYYQFFPEAKQVISPKFRISKLLGSSASDSQMRFWFLLNQLAKGMAENKGTIEQLRYQSKTLIVTLVSTDFASLELLENQLKKLQLNVKQTQAATRDQQVVATLELT